MSGKAGFSGGQREPHESQKRSRRSRSAPGGKPASGTGPSSGAGADFPGGNGLTDAGHPLSTGDSQGSLAAADSKAAAHSQVSPEQSTNPAPSPTSAHGPALVEALSTAFSWLTIAPFHGARVFDRTTGRRAMSAMPVVGFALGAVAALLALLIWLIAGREFTAEASWLAAFFIVAAWALGTRLMHVDGLSDVADALGSYAPPEKARAILADVNAGPMGIAAVGLAGAAQLIGVRIVLGSNWSSLDASPIGIPAPWIPLLVIVLLPALSRTAALTLCHVKARPASPNGFGALVIGTVSTGVVAGWWLFMALCAALLAGMWGVLLVGVLVAVTLVWARHVHRRFAGFAGDCLGATIELVSAVGALGWALLAL